MSKSTNAKNHESFESRPTSQIVGDAVEMALISFGSGRVPLSWFDDRLRESKFNLLDLTPKSSDDDRERLIYAKIIGLMVLKDSYGKLLKENKEG